MKKLAFVHLILFTIWIERGIYGENQNYVDDDQVKDAPPPIPLYKLRRLGLFEMRIIKDWEALWKSYELSQRILKAIEQGKLKKKNQKILNYDAKRRKIYEQYLLPFQGGSNVLKDLNTNRF